MIVYYIAFKNKWKLSTRRSRLTLFHVLCGFGRSGIRSKRPLYVGHRGCVGCFEGTAAKVPTPVRQDAAERSTPAPARPVRAEKMVYSLLRVLARTEHCRAPLGLCKPLLLSHPSCLHAHVSSEPQKSVRVPVCLEVFSDSQSARDTLPGRAAILRVGRRAAHSELGAA
ncbi:hypothetical protein KL906_002024 [Ogataea polymorpha]|nr:hypothetical protein KL937_004856 [Ogataea polymorpha]KAG7910119.1 hypothetical protein KL906_002024 [Ogataea polymorpha]KAG7931876.1 hypothetical protein KL904_004917 [Ogataea polymorpha]